MQITKTQYRYILIQLYKHFVHQTAKFIYVNVHTYVCEYAKDVLPIFLKQKVLDTLTSHCNGR